MKRPIHKYKNLVGKYKEGLKCDENTKDTPNTKAEQFCRNHLPPMIIIYQPFHPNDLQ